MREEILKKLSPITDKEKKFLSGKKDEKRSQNINWKDCNVNSNKLLIEGNLISLYPHPRFVHIFEHSNDYVQVVYMCQGMITYIINRETITLREGELLLLTPNSKRQVLPASENDIAVNFIVKPEFFETVLQTIENEQILFNSFVIDILGGEGKACAYMHFKISDIVPVQNLAENLIWSFVFGNANNCNINYDTMKLLLLNLLNHTDRMVGKKDDKVVLSVLNYIEENYKNGSLTELSESIHYNFTWLSREIRARTGKTYTELVQNKRLSQAKFLLRNTTMKITDVANETGYGNISYFYRLFKNKIGVSPKKYREGGF